MAVSRAEVRASRHCFAFYEIHATTIVSLRLLRSLDALRPSMPSAFLNVHHDSAHRKTSLIRSIDPIADVRYMLLWVGQAVSLARPHVRYFAIISSILWCSASFSKRSSSSVLPM
jgi:hypothetical protein